MLSSSFFRRFDLLQGKFYFHIFGIVFFAFCIVCLYVELLEMTCGIKLMIFLKIILIFVCLDFDIVSGFWPVVAWLQSSGR